jgi:hypothetical protein
MEKGEKRWARYWAEDCRVVQMEALKRGLDGLGSEQ